MLRSVLRHASRIGKPILPLAWGISAGTRVNQKQELTPAIIMFFGVDIVTDFESPRRNPAIQRSTDMTSECKIQKIMYLSSKNG